MKSDYKSWINFLKFGMYKESSPFLQFAVLWLSFNAYLNEIYGQKINGDKNKVLKFINEAQNNKYYERLCSNSEFIEVISSFEQTKSPSRLFVNNMQTRSEKDRKPFDRTHKSLKDFLIVIYQIRCNFFHGDKIPYNQDDQKIINWAYKYFYIFWSDYLDI